MSAHISCHVPTQAAQLRSTTIEQQQKNKNLSWRFGVLRGASFGCATTGANKMLECEYFAALSTCFKKPLWLSVNM